MKKKNKAREAQIKEEFDAMVAGDTGINTGTVTTTFLQLKCKGCGGEGIQTRTDNGLRVSCPVCGGGGNQPARPFEPAPFVQPYPNTAPWPCGPAPFVQPYPNTAPYPARFKPVGGTAYLMVYNAVKAKEQLVHGHLHEKGESCAIGSYFDINAGCTLDWTLIDEIAAVNDSVPSFTPKQRRLHVMRWLGWKLRQLGMPGFTVAAKKKKKKRTKY